MQGGFVEMVDLAATRPKHTVVTINDIEQCWFNQADLSHPDACLKDVNMPYDGR